MEMQDMYIIRQIGAHTQIRSVNSRGQLHKNKLQSQSLDALEHINNNSPDIKDKAKFIYYPDLKQNEKQNQSQSPTQSQNKSIEPKQFNFEKISKLKGLLKKSLANRITKKIIEEEQKRKEQTKIHEKRKILRSRIFQLIQKALIEQPCKKHGKHQCEFDMKIEFIGKSRLSMNDSLDQQRKSPSLEQMQSRYKYNHHTSISGIVNPYQSSAQSSRNMHNSPIQLQSFSISPLDRDILNGQIGFHTQKQIDFNQLLIVNFTEEELQEMFEDVRFYFPDEDIYERIEIFKVLDIFNGDHRNIKKAYKSYKRKQRIQQKINSTSFDTKDNTDIKLSLQVDNHDSGIQGSISQQNNSKQLIGQSIQVVKQSKEIQLIEKDNISTIEMNTNIRVGNLENYEQDKNKIDLDKEVGLLEDNYQTTQAKKESHFHIMPQKEKIQSQQIDQKELEGNNKRITENNLNENDEGDGVSLPTYRRLSKLTVDEYKQFQQYRDQVQSKQHSRHSSNPHSNIINIITPENKFFKQNRLLKKLSSLELVHQQNKDVSSHAKNPQDIAHQTKESNSKKEDQQNVLEKQLRYQMKLKQVELNKIRNVYNQVASQYLTNVYVKSKQQHIAKQRQIEVDSQNKIVAKYLPMVQNNFNKVNKITQEKDQQRSNFLLKNQQFGLHLQNIQNNEQKGIFSYRSSREHSNTNSTKHIQLQPDYSLKLDIRGSGGISTSRQRQNIKGFHQNQLQPQKQQIQKL